LDVVVTCSMNRAFLGKFLGHLPLESKTFSSNAALKSDSQFSETKVTPKRH
jgi:hypothetical protein